MTLRVRLAVLLALALVAAVVITGVVGLQRMEAALIEEVDDVAFSRIGTAAGPPTNAASLGGGAGQGPAPADGDTPAAEPRSGLDDDGRNVADYVVTPDGELLAEFAAGTTENRLPRLDLDLIVGRDILEPETLPSEDGSVRYRVLSRRTLEGNFRVVAASLASADETIGDLRRTIGVAGFAAALFGALVGWFVIRRETRPIDHFLASADAFAAGDLDARAEGGRPGSEIGRLGAGLNDAFDRVGESVRAETAAKERLSAFVDDIAHELRTPATTIAGWAELYETGALTDPADVDRMVQRISGETARLAGLVDEMVLLARHDTVRTNLLTDVDVVEVVTDVVDDANALDDSRTIRMQTSGAAIVRGDRTRLVQVIANVLDNARVHTPAGTPVDVRIHSADSMVRIEVVDDGPGIPAGHVDRVFDRSFRAATAGARGRGLGLAIVKAIVEDHGGAIAIRSLEGQGTTVEISLPAG
ncbi:MAG: HAMP domain-containing sensor histidine kinase [Actinomycetota bacterium]